MEKWQIDMIKQITIGNPNYDSKKALQLAKDWQQTDEKFMMITDEFCISVDSAHVDYWVDRIEDRFEKILEVQEKTKKELEDNWLRLCGE